MEIRKKAKNENLTDKMINEFISASDPMGGYTGTPLDKENPVQDADDL